MRIAIFAVALALTGCEVSSPITPAGKDTYMVSSHVGACVSCSARIQSMKTANAYCAKSGLFAIVRTIDGATNPFGYDNGNTMVFSCVSADDPEWKRLNLRPDNGVTTLEQR